MKKLLLILLLPFAATAQDNTFISFTIAPASANHIIKDVETQATFGGYYGISIGKIKSNISYSAGLAMMLGGVKVANITTSDKHVALPLQVGVYGPGTVRPFFKLSVIPSYLFAADVEGTEFSNAYSENKNTWNLSGEASAGVRIPIKQMGFIDFGVGYLRQFTSMQKGADEFPQMISGIVTLTSLIR